MEQGNELNCPACGAANFEFDSGAGGEVCTACGTLTSKTNYEYEVLGRVLDGQDDEFGRNYLRDDGFLGGQGRSREGRLLGKTNQTVMYDYHRVRMGASERYIRSLLAHFDLTSLYQRTRVLFTQAKTAMNFRWGDKAKVIATCCVYIVSRERERGLPLIDLAAIAEIEYNTLARAQNKIKNILGIETAELDPIVFLDRLLVHMSDLLKSSSNPLLSGNPTKTSWTPANLIWLRSLKMKEVRSLADGILAFASEVSLSVGRLPEQIACAIILNAMEGTARHPAPNGTEILQELGCFMGVKCAAITDRYREVHRALADYAPTVPWIGESGRSCNKRELAKYVEDIVNFRKSKNVKAALENNRKLLIDEDIEFTENLIEENPSNRGAEASTSQIRIEVDDEEGEEDDAGGLLAAFPDPFSSHKQATPALMNNVTPVVAGRPSPRIATPLVIPTDPLRSQPRQISAHKTANGKRPVEYMKSGSSNAKRRRTIELVASSLLTPFTPSPSSSPSASLKSSPTPRPHSFTPCPRRNLSPITSAVMTEGAQFHSAHDSQTVQTRRLLLAGHDIKSITDKSGNGLVWDEDALSGGPSNHRLMALLWTKTAEEITDEELFGEGELDGFVRSEAEVNLLAKTDRFASMPAQKSHLELEMEKEKERRRGSYKKRIKRNVTLEAEGEEEGEGEYIYVKKSKADPNAMTRMAEYFEVDNVDILGDGDYRSGLNQSAVMLEGQVGRLIGESSGEGE